MKKDKEGLLSQGFDILVQTTVKRMTGECMTVTNNDDFHTGTGDGHIHTAQVTQKTYLSFLVATHQRYYDDITLLTLKAINSIHRDETAERFEELTLAHLLT